MADALGVSTRTLQEWEQGRRQPSAALRTPLAIAANVLREVLAEKFTGRDICGIDLLSAAQESTAGIVPARLLRGSERVTLGEAGKSFC